MFENGKELKVVEYDKFGNPRNEEDLIELNRIISGQREEVEETKAEKKDRKKKEKAAKKKAKAANKKKQADKKVLDGEENKE